jgi:hypothetical protein
LSFSLFFASCIVTRCPARSIVRGVAVGATRGEWFRG